MKYYPIPLLTLLLFISITGFSQNENQFKLQLNSGSKIPRQNISAEYIYGFNQKLNRVNGKAFTVIQFEKIPTEAERTQLFKSGIQLHDYISGNAYTATVINTIDANSLLTVKARSIFEMDPTDKMHITLAKEKNSCLCCKDSGHRGCLD